jgi:hypothetical protein
VFEVRWREGGRNKSLRVHGAHELARKIERKKMSVRDENRHLDVKRTGSTAREMWKLLEQPKLLEAVVICETANILSDVRV